MEHKVETSNQCRRTPSSSSLAAADHHRPSPPPNPSFKPSKQLEQAIKNQTDATLKITKQLLLVSSKTNNMVYSPVSIHVVLSMLAAGMKKGPTQDKLLRFLNSNSVDELNHLASNVVPFAFADGSSTGGPRLSSANGVWVDNSRLLNPCYKELMEATYKASLNQVDFKTKHEQVRGEVNSWAEKETNGCIEEIIPQGLVNNLTRLVLANALYFKGAWNEGFDLYATRSMSFHLLNGSSIRARFMTSSRSRYISAFQGFKVLKLPYKQGGDSERRFSLLVYLPNKWTGLQELVERFCNSESLFSSETGFIDRYTPRHMVPVGRFCIPKFKISAGFDALDVLKPLGVSLQEADFTEMVDENLEISKILHKSFIEVNEEGTEAAAVTAAVFAKRAAAERPSRMDFVADHPFLYLIREEVTGAVMFMGHVLNPLHY